MGLDRSRALAFAAAVGSLFFGVVLAAGIVLRIGPVAPLLGLISGAGAFYLVCTEPRRKLRVATFEQTMEAPSFAAASNIYLKSTGSKSKTLLMLKADEPLLDSFLSQVRRKVMLGFDTRSAIALADPATHIFSESVATVIDSVAGVERARVEDGSDELDGMLNSAALEEESKLPLFIAVAFFLPIMLMLFAAVAKGTGPADLGALIVLELVILDVAFSISATGSHLGAGGGR